MPIRNEREYRNLGGFEIRQETPEADVVVGYASTFDTYELFDDPEFGKVYERIDPKAFDGADMSDVVFLRDHTGRVLARTKNGSVKLSTDTHGLLSETNLGLDHWEGNTRVVDRIKKLYDISAVAFPANPYTDIGLSARDLFHGEMERQAERLESEKREQIRKRLALKIKLMKEGKE